jgi:hypothetical protein
MFPDVSEAFWGWTNPVVYQVVTPTIVDHEVEQVLATARTIDGVMEPLTPQRLALKPEGMRNWKWWRLWTTGNLQNGDIVTDPEGKTFQVQDRSDWRSGGYVEYEVTEKPT